MVPPKVESIYDYWAEPPPEQSERLTYWLNKIANGWRRNRRIKMMGYSGATEFFGVYLWEYLNVLHPIFLEQEKAEDE